MEVPQYNQNVGVEGGEVPSGKITPLGPEAVPTAQLEAGINAGQKVSQVAGYAARALVYQKRLQARTDAYDRAAKYAQGIDQVLNGPNGLLQTQGSNAIGILHGKPLPDGEVGPSELDPNSYLGQERKLRETALNGVSAGEKVYVERLLNSHNDVAFNAVLKHEAQQTKQYRLGTAQALVSSNANMFAADPSSPGAQALLTHSQQIMSGAMSNAGVPPEELPIHQLKVGDQFAQAMVQRNLDDHPDVAKSALDEMHSKGQISEAMYGTLKARVEGKWLDMRTNAVADQVLKDPANINADLTVNFGTAEAQVKHLVSTLPAPDQTKIIDAVHQRIARQNAAVAQKRQEDERNVATEMMQAQRNGVPAEQAYDQFIKKRDFMTEQDRQSAEKLFQQVYTRDPQALDKIMQTQTPDQKLAWDWVQKIAQQKFGKNAAVLPGDDQSGVKTPLADAFVAEMKHKYLGKSPAEIRQAVTTELKDQPTTPGWAWAEKIGLHWGENQKPQWQIDRDVHNMELDKRAALIQKYGAPLISESEAFLKKNNKRATPEDIAAVAEQAKRGR